MTTLQWRRECCREAAVQTQEEAVCHCPTTDLDADDELPHDEPQPAQAQPSTFNEAQVPTACPTPHQL
ncbi:hypothetical protein MRX96_052093 [Rhipicephalus microplus]